MATHLWIQVWRAVCSEDFVQSQSVRNPQQTAVLSHFGLRENPFGVTPDPKFLFFSHTHREAVASLINGIDWGFGFQVLVAQPGMGKTTLLINLLSRYQATAHTAFLFQPQLSPIELLQSLLSELGVNSQASSIRSLGDDLNQFLLGATRAGKRVIIILDEAQNLDFASLEMLRQLSNFETSRSKLMNVILAGQPQLLKNLSAPEQQQLQQRVSAIGRISPLSAEDTSLYIEHRLKTAGASKTGLFPPTVIHEIWQSSNGIPRNINRLCFSTMLLAFTEHANLISRSVLQEAISNLDPQQIFSQMRTPEEKAKHDVLEMKTPLVHKIPVGAASEPILAAAALPIATTGTNSGIKIPVPIAKPADNRGVDNARPSAQPAITTSNANVVVTDKQPSHENLKVAVIGTARTQNTKTGLRVAEVRLNNLKSVRSDRQHERRNGRFWSNVFLISVFTGLLLWFVIGRAASGSWPQTSRFAINPSTSNPSPSSGSSSEPAAVKSRPIATLYFEEASATLDSQSQKSSLEEVANMLAANPDLYVVLEGHTDDSGPETYNLDLSGRRSLAVRDVLSNQLQVSPERLKVTALGSAEPVQPNSSDTGRARNRRVEIRVAKRQP